jgi:mannitol/fructose-specific phosphotransferase system IIA component (Ntr-type)
MAVMHLASILSADQILADMKAKERWPAILELVDLLVDHGHLKMDDRQPILDALREREDSMSTGIGFGVAIPHASSDRVDRVVAAFGRSRAGIGFDSLDNEPVRFIVLFIVPQDQFSLHLRTLAAIAKFLNERGVRERLREAESVEEILETLRGAAARV